MKKMIPKLIGAWLNFLAPIAPLYAGKKGFLLFCKVRAAPLKDYHLKFFETAARDSFEMEGRRIQTYRWGNGPRKVLFLHGWQSHSFRWKKYVEALSPVEYTIYALDAPAHGLSSGKYINLPLYARIVSSFINQIQGADTVVTHSFGGFALLYAIYMNPSLPAKRIVLMGTPGEASEFFAHYQKILGLSRRAMTAVRGYFVSYIGYPPEFFSSRVFAASVKVPTLIIHDPADADAPYNHAVGVHEAIGGSTMMTVKNAGHNLKGPEVLNAVLEFAGQRQAFIHQ